MSLIAVTSAGDSPGATTTAFAMTLTWPGRVLLAECSPSGGRILRGYFRCHTPPDGGLWNLALAAVHGQDTAQNALWQQVVPLDEQRQHLLLPGLIDPFLSTELSADTWEILAETFADLPFAVLADVGPVGPEQPFALLRAAQLVVVVMRPTLAQVAAARPRVARIRQALGAATPLGLCVIGDRPYTARDIRAQLGEFAATFNFPIDTYAAQVLSEGSDSDRARRRIEASPLLRAARSAGHTVLGYTSGLHHFAPRPSPGRAAAGGAGRE